MSGRTCKVATFNANSIRSRLELLLDWLHRERPDILCLQETKVQDVDFHPLAREALEQVRQWGFVDIFRKHHPDEPGQYTFWDYRVRGALERGLGWRVDHIWATEPLAQKSKRAWVDLEARKAKQPSDHTFLAAEFDL